MLMRVARSRWGGRVVGWVFAKMSFALPVKRLVETERVMAFEHPSPGWAVHILVVPKVAVAGLEALGAERSALLGEIFAVIEQVVVKLGLEQYRVIVNGGEYQEVKQLHFHLVAGETLSRAS
ncbi:MAG TPA: HIT domain-containing protein [Anaerolineales bacterium]|nr:HIT domain-containing protein [Anaerolineales bacterium]